MKKIALVVPYFGKFPKWINLYFETCKWNPTIDWIIFSDRRFQHEEIRNVKFIKMTKEEFNILASSELKLKVKIGTPYKLCDLKPTYGVIFKEYLADYDFWGHTDLDVLFGDIRKFITEDLLAHYDIITAYKLFLCGHFTLYKNVDIINSLYKEYANYKEIIEDMSMYRGFDERHFTKTVKIAQENKRVNLFLGAFALDDKNAPDSFYTNDVGMRAHEIGEMRVGKGYWEKGRIFCTGSETEMMYFHFHNWKEEWGGFFFYVRVLGKINRLEVSPNGFMIMYPGHCEVVPNALALYFAKVKRSTRSVIKNFENAIIELLTKFLPPWMLRILRKFYAGLTFCIRNDVWSIINQRLKNILIASIIKIYAQRNEQFFFIEIGSNDGVTNDFVRKYILKYKWGGLFVEPVKYLFDKLVNNYPGHNNLFFENAAISLKSGIKHFYSLKENDKLPVWYDQLGSFNLNHILNHRGIVPHIEDYIISEEVKCVTLDDLLRKYKINTIDLLQVDIEGYDDEVIKSINFDTVKPNMIRYEHRWLDRNKKNECELLLKSNGYLLIEDNEDTFAFLNPINMRTLLKKE